MSERGQALRNTLLSSVAIYVEYVLGMLASILVARELGPEHYGTYSLIIWMAGLGVAFTNSGTATAAIKFVAELRGGDQESMIPTALRFLRRAQQVFLGVVALAGAVLIWLFGRHMLPGYDDRLIFGALLLAVSLRAPYMFNIAVAKGFECFRATATIASIATPINLALVLGAWYLHAPVLGFLLVYLVSGAVFYLVSFWQVRKLERPLGRGIPMPPALRARVFRHMRIVAVTVAVSFLGAREVEVLFLKLYDSAAAAGHFKVAYQLASGAALLVPGVFSALLLPMMAHAVTRGKDFAAQRFVSSTTYLAMLAVPLMAFGVIFAAPVIQVLFGAAYAPAAPVFAVLLCAGSLAAMSGAASGLLISADRQHHMLVLTLLTATLKIALDWWWVKVAGLPGAVAANFTVAVLGTAAVLGLAMHMGRTGLAWGRLARIALAGGAAALCAWPLHHLLPPGPRILAGFVVVSLTYAFATVLFGCWSRADMEYIQTLLVRVSGGRPRWLMRLLTKVAGRGM